jgi:hypothetical protein
MWPLPPPIEPVDIQSRPDGKTWRTDRPGWTLHVHFEPQESDWLGDIIRESWIPPMRVVVFTIRWRGEPAFTMRGVPTVTEDSCTIRSEPLRRLFQDLVDTEARGRRIQELEREVALLRARL